MVFLLEVPLQRRARPAGSTDRAAFGQTPGHLAELRSFPSPDLGAIERRRLQLWSMTLMLLVAAAATLALVAGSHRIELPGWASPLLLQLGLLALAILFSAYTLERETALRSLTRQLLREQVLSAALTSRLEEANAVLEAGRCLHRRLELEEVLETILEAAVDLLDARDGSIMLVHGSDELRTVATRGSSQARGARVPVGEGIAGRVASTREPVLISGTFAWRHYRKGSGALPTSAVSVPLSHRDELLGVLNVNAHEGRSFSEHDLRPLSVFAEQASAAVASAQLIETQRAIASQSAFHAQHDPLTGLPNRAALLERIEAALRRIDGVEPCRCALLLVDLDDFRRVNNSLGHAAGDQLLSEAARRLRQTVRSGDTVARVGADEFALLLVQAEADEASSAVSRLQAALASPFRIEGRDLAFTVSIGIAFGHDVASGADDLLRSANTALFAAKTRGAGRVETFEPTMRADAVRSLDLEQALRRALDRDQFEVHYQPIVRLSSGRPIGLEALIRWRHPSGELLDAGDFLPFAERAGLIGAIDRWVVSSACSALAPSFRALRPEPRLSFNLSPVTLQDPELSGDLATILRGVGFEPSRLVLEVTETALLTDTEPVAARLRELRALGVRVALDDFGTGYSSLSWLRAFPVDQVKIDRVFVEALERDPGATAVVEAIVRLGRGLAFEVVAEGIGSDLQISRLLALGCTLGQGFHLARPLELPDALASLDGGFGATRTSAESA